MNRMNRTMKTRTALLLAALASAFLCAPFAALTALAAEPAVTIPPPTAAPADNASSETAVLAGGCFWGVQAVFQHVKGVTTAVSGYAGGAQKDAYYQTVSSGRTGHAESVRVTFDPKQISYGKILQIYFSVAHDPTQLNRQGPDTGTQYRSEIFPQSEAQAKTAKDYIAQLDAAHVFRRPIVTKVDTVKASFFPAEAYHQDYATLHPYQPYIAFNDTPKVENLKKTFPDLWREKPVLVSEAEKTN
ncbi:MAG TPA: peptide-methionine (S)-S-oxide reductase MsrA [Stellaceae bacterium]|nr:peptide-methionine (S)-S-oxide reductase MsrA [Stellaceae bacterium]